MQHLEDYSGGLLLIRNDETQYFYKELLADIKYITSITTKQWEEVIKENHEKNCLKKL